MTNQQLLEFIESSITMGKSYRQIGYDLAVQGVGLGDLVECIAKGEGFSLEEVPELGVGLGDV